MIRQGKRSPHAAPGRRSFGLAIGVAVGLTAVGSAAACSASTSPSPSRPPSPHTASATMPKAPVAFVCLPAPGAEIETPDQICGEVLAALNQNRPDLSFVAGAPGRPAAEVTISHAHARGLGLQLTWIDAEGGRSQGAPMGIAFFDRGSDIDARSRFYAAVLAANPAPF